MQLRLIKILLLSFVMNSTMAQNSSNCPEGGSQDGLFGSGGLDSLAKKVANYIDILIRVVRSIDPNDIVGPKGYADKQFVSVKNKMGFTVRFENSANFATAPAQNVTVHLPVDPKININSLRLSNFGFGTYRFDVPENSTYYTGRLDLRDSLGLFVDLTSGIDIINNEIFWIFRSIDPATGLAPAEAMKGFLAINDTTAKADSAAYGAGEGFVSFYVVPDSTIAKTGDTVSAKASIVFDINEPIETNTWQNTIDAVAPVSNIESASAKNGDITLNWSGIDDAGGSGVKEYALYVSENNQPYELFQDKIADHSIVYPGIPGNSYCFYTLATDHTGNTEPEKINGCEFAVTLNLDGTALPLTWLYIDAKQSGEDVLLQWGTVAEENTKYFVIERSTDGVNFVDAGTVVAAGNSVQTQNYTFTDRNATQLQSPVLYYRLRQIDADGNYSYSNVEKINIRSKAPVIKAFPNPFRYRLSLTIQHVSRSDKAESVSLYTRDGRLVYHRKLQHSGNATILLDDIPPFAAGVYILQAVINGRAYTMQLLRE
ncbi:MAG: T9SS type A sorting domain-containing protein [Chitinophagaceae bacterium]|nr:T9SS type A sorting domain-containing protein [Chitinophagaceae bacterium]